MSISETKNLKSFDNWLKKKKKKNKSRIYQYMQIIESLLAPYQILPGKCNNVNFKPQINTNSLLPGHWRSQWKRWLVFTTFPRILCSEVEIIRLSLHLQWGGELKWYIPAGPRQLKCLWVVHIPSLLSTWLKVKTFKGTELQGESRPDPWHCWKRSSKHTCLTCLILRQELDRIELQLGLNLFERVLTFLLT